MVPAKDISHVGEALEHKSGLQALHSGFSMQCGGQIIHCGPSCQSNLLGLSPPGENTESREVDAVRNAIADAEDGLPGELKEDPNSGEEFELSYDKS